MEKQSGSASTLWAKVKGLFSGGSARRRVLIIDDDRGLLKLVKSNLAAKGLAVLTAATGEEGLETAQREKPDVILLDVILPGIKGREVCAKLKDDPRTQNIPVIFLTAKDSPDDVKAELEVGALSHITKPLNSDSLLQEINRVLGV